MLATNGLCFRQDSSAANMIFFAHKHFPVDSRYCFLFYISVYGAAIAFYFAIFVIWMLRSASDVLFEFVHSLQILLENMAKLLG